MKKFCWILMLFSTLLSAQNKYRPVNLLVPPRVAEEMVPGRAVSVGTQLARYVGPVESESPAVIIADLASTPVNRHACLLQEVSAILPELGDIPIYSPVDSERKNLYSVEMSNGLHFGLLSDASQLEKLCKESLRSHERIVALDASVYMMSLIRALTSHYAEKGPLRIYWLSANFRIYDWRNNMRRPSPIEFTRYPSIVEQLAPSISESSAVLFPIQLETPKQDRKFLASSTSSAEHLAVRTGGFFSATTEVPGAGLKFALSRSQQYKTVRLEVPDPILTSGIHPANIYLNSFDRVIVTTPAPEPPKLAAAGIRIVPFREDFEIAGGCPEKETQEPWIHFQFPEAVLKASSREVLLHIEVIPKRGKALRRRLSLNLNEPLCLALQDDLKDQTHIVVAHEETTNWTAVRTFQIQQKNQ